MPTIGSYQAKTQFSQLIERVVRGERITITRHGVPVAMLSPVSTEATWSVQEVIADLKTFRRGQRLEGLSVQEMKQEGRA